MLETSHIDLEKAGGEGAPRVCQSNRTSVFAQISPGICRLESKELDFQLFCFPPLTNPACTERGEARKLSSYWKQEQSSPSFKQAGGFWFFSPGHRQRKPRAV